MSPLIIFLGAQLMWHIDLSQSWPSSCPQKCKCEVTEIAIRLLNEVRNLKTVDCSHGGLQRIPRDLPVDAEAILLQNNSITMHVGINQMPQLRVLDLSYNSIQGFFGRLLLPQLQHLDCGYNLIPRVSSSDNDFFAPLRNLLTLSLRGNVIDSLDADTLDLPALKVLDLAENNLTSLSARIFADLHQLSALDLSQNHISGVKFGIAFESMELERLNLSDNDITVFATSNFKVQSLDLSNNGFVTLNKQTFRGLKVEEFYVNHIPNLWFVSDATFSNVYGLRKVDLTGNYNLTYIEQGAFRNLPNLTSVLLDDTSLNTLPSEITQNPVIPVSLSRVPLLCQLSHAYLLTVANKNVTCHWQDREVTIDQLQQIVTTSEWRRALPVILPTFPKALEADLGSILEIQCLTAGNVTGVNWVRLDERRKREYPLPSFSGVLRAGPLYRVDSGRFLCRAYNQYGNVNRSVQVNVTYAPVILIPLTVTQQYVTFAFNNSDPSIASQFRVKYFEQTGANFTHIRTIFMEHLVRTYTISNLKPGTVYKICLLLNKSGNVEELDCKNITTKAVEMSNRTFRSAYEVLVAIGCISSLLFFIFMSTCVYRFYQEKRQDSMSESLSRILLSDSSCVTSEATTPTTYFNPGVDPLTPTTEMDVRAAFLPENHPYRNVAPAFDGRPRSHVQSTAF